MPERIIVDCDPGITRPAADIDDALALALLLRSPEVELAGITVTAGNVDVDAAAEGVLAVLEAAGRTDIPVYRGAARPETTTTRSGTRRSGYGARIPTSRGSGPAGSSLTLAEAHGIADSAADPLGRLVADALLRWTEFSVSVRGRAGCVLHDPLAAALALDPTLVTTTARVAATDLHGRLSPGRLVTWNPDTVYAPAAALPRRRPVTLATDVDNDRLVRLLVERLPGR